MYVNYKNKSSNIISVTTNDAKFYYEGKHIASPYKNNIQLVKLQGNQEITFTAITDIGTEYNNTIYSAVSIVTYKQININDFNFILESRGQITEKRILLVAIYNIEKKMHNFLKLFKNNNIEITDLEGTIEINNQTHTLGNLITHGLQLHKDVNTASYNLPHPLIEKILLHYSIKKNNIKSIMEDVINYYLKLFEKIKVEFETII